MKCQEVARQLSAYLDGELGDHATSALRGHLRTCDQCRNLADAEAKLVESLRQLPALDPPAALWQAVRTQLAEQEIADARAGWVARLGRKARPYLPQLGGGVLAAAAAAALLWWPSGVAGPGGTSSGTSGTLAASGNSAGNSAGPSSDPSGGPSADPSADPFGAATPTAVVDVATALTDEAALADQSYQEATAELLALIEQERASWDGAYARRYDARVAELRASAAGAAGPARERAQRELMRYLQSALTRAELAMGAP